jgi:hypothetical protein
MGVRLVERRHSYVAVVLAVVVVVRSKLLAQAPLEVAANAVCLVPGGQRAESTVKSATVLRQHASPKRDLKSAGGRNHSDADNADNAAEQSSTRPHARHAATRKESHVNLGNALDRHGGDLQHFRCGHNRAEHCGDKRAAKRIRCADARRRVHEVDV